MTEPISTELPRPVASAWSEAYWAGLERGEFLLQVCENCATLQGYPKPICKRCGSDRLGWQTASGEATVYTWTRLEANPPSPFVAELPYTLVIAELVEGVRYLGRFVGDREPECGQALRISFDARHDGLRLPTFSAA